jgi:hypothetical protein
VLLYESPVKILGNRSAKLPSLAVLKITSERALEEELAEMKACFTSCMALIYHTMRSLMICIRPQILLGRSDQGE